MKKKAIVLAANFNELSKKPNRSKAEKEQLFKLRRALENAGIPTNVSITEMMDFALVIDNMPKVTGYISRVNGKKNRNARRSNGKKQDKIVANLALEAKSLKDLGFTSVDIRYLERLISEIAMNKHQAHKMKKYHVDNNKRYYDIDDSCDIYDDELYDEEGFSCMPIPAIVGAQV
ncbi:MAG: hypothetical protein MJ154_03805 [Candidatus Saccharibacteria bacterium]|nr:hypothetical protein [Candidatus Saccharibacteria bacterium]